MQKTFKNTGDEFSGYNAAEEWLTANGYSYGPMQSHSPTAIYKGDCFVSKWRSLNAQNLREMDGTIDAGDFRFDDVVVTFKREIGDGK